MERIIITISLLMISSFAFAEKINSEYPVCISETAIKDFISAKYFSNVEKMQALIEDDQCLFVEPDIKASVLDRTLYPKVLVFIPYKKPIVGWTSPENFK